MNLQLSTLDLILLVALLIMTGIIIYLCYSLFHGKQEPQLLKQALMQKEQEILALKQNLNKYENNFEHLRQEHASLRENYASLSGERNIILENNKKLQNKLDELSTEASDLREAMSAAGAALDAEKQMREDDRLKSQERDEELKNRLTILGQQMLKATATELSNQERLNFQKNVAPLKEELEIFRRFLTQSQNQSASQSGSLLTELKKMQESQNVLSKQALDLSLALSSGGKSQGMWGELQLERVLENSGLTLGIEYEREVAGVRYQNETGRPDAIIRLPQNHCLIIDAKCSLTAYTNFVNASDKDEKESALKAHISSLKNHINGLKKRDYSNYKSLNSPSFVFMFVPIDGALSLAINKDSSLYDEASQSNIYLVSPSSLLPALRVVANLWVLSKQNERIRALASEAQQIYAKFSQVLNALEDVQKKESSLNSSIELLNNRLRGGKGNLEGQLQNFAVKAPQVLAQEGLEIKEA